MKQRFNLVDEPWLPVVEHGRASLREVFSCAEMTGLGGTPLEKIAMFKLLQAVAQAACTPADDAAWQALGVEGMGKACVAYLEQWHDAFWLYGERPFLQFPAVAKAKVRPYGAFLPEVASGNTSVVFQSQLEPTLNDAERALLLLVNMSCCLSGKQVDKSIVLSQGVEKSPCAKAGPALCSPGLLHSFFMGSSIQETVWFNLLTQADIAEERTFTEGVGTPPWECMPTGERDKIAQDLQQSLMGRLVPLARFYLLGENGVHSVEGIQHPDYLHGGMLDPSAAGDFSKNKPTMIWTDPSRRPWRSLTSLLSFLNHAPTNGVHCPQLTWCAARLRRPGLGEFQLWSGGVRLSNNRGEQYLSGDDDMVESSVVLHADWFDREGSLWFDTLQQAMGQLESFGKGLYGSVASYHKAVKNRNAKGYARCATLHFWHRAEQNFSPLSQACSMPDQQDALKTLLDRMKACALDCYTMACPRDTARQLELWIQHRPRFRGAHNKKAGDRNGTD